MVTLVTNLTNVPFVTKLTLNRMYWLNLFFEIDENIENILLSGRVWRSTWISTTVSNHTNVISAWRNLRIHQISVSIRQQHIPFKLHIRLQVFLLNFIQRRENHRVGGKMYRQLSWYPQLLYSSKSVYSARYYETIVWSYLHIALPIHSLYITKKIDTNKLIIPWNCSCHCCQFDKHSIR